MAQFGQEAVGRALHRGPGDDRGNGHAVPPSGLDRRPQTGHGEHRSDGHERVGRGDDDPFGVGQGGEGGGGGVGVLHAGEADGGGLDVVVAAHEVVLEADLALVHDRDHGPDGIVAHGHQRQAQVPGGDDLAGDLGQGGALPQPLGPVEVGTQVPIAQVEPGHPAVAPEGLHGLPGLADQAPAGLGVDRPGQGVGDRVDVGADVQAVQLDIVAGVDHRGDRRRVDDLHEAAQHPGGAHPSGHHRHGGHGVRRSRAACR